MYHVPIHYTRLVHTQHLTLTLSIRVRSSETKVYDIFTF